MKIQSKRPLNKRTKTILLISIPCVIILIIVGIIFAITFYQNNKINPEIANVIISESIQNTFENTKKDNIAFISDVLETASVSVLSVTQKDNNTAVAHCRIKSRDAYNSLKKVAEDYGEVNTTAPALLVAYSKELEQSSFIESDVDIILIKENEKWLVDYSYDALNALMGGYLQYSYEAMEQIETEE